LPIRGPANLADDTPVSEVAPEEVPPEEEMIKA
jgi:hypothetical protein